MTGEIRTINLILVVAGLVIATIGLVQVFISSNIEKKTRYFFFLLFAVLDLYVLCILTRGLTYSRQDSAFWPLLSEIVLFGQAFFASVLTVIITAFLLYQSGEKKWFVSPFFRVSLGFWLVYVVLLVSNFFTGAIYNVDQYNIYTRGPLFPTLVVPTILIMAVNLLAVFVKRRSLTKKQRYAFIIYSVFPMIAMVIQSRVFGIHLIALSSVIAAVFMLTFIFSDQTERYYIKEAENSRLKLDILLAQIQPHFLYNSLITIRHICGNDAAKAQEAIDIFVAYLRHNMDSLTTDRTVDFLTELDHVKGYLALQKLRFGDDLSVEYFLATTDFKLPTLTLQPLVENAVTYGIRKKNSGKGTVIIRTRFLGDVVELSVEDDGPGFSNDNNEAISLAEGNKSHVGLANVRERIESICGGKLIIDSEPGKGTKVVIRLERRGKC